MQRYLDNVEKPAVVSGRDIALLFQRGNKHRTTGSTKMNATSSRSHAIFTLYIQQESQEGVKKVCKMNLIDLAGSERAASTGATGQRLKEGAQINKSLSALGQVIHALGMVKKGSGEAAATGAGGDGGNDDGAVSKTKKGPPRASSHSHIPYRDSKLTRLLQDSLGGNSVTMMIANISPATINLSETLSSLRFASRAKEVKNQVSMNYVGSLNMSARWPCVCASSSCLHLEVCIPRLGCFYLNIVCAVALAHV